MIFTDKIQTRFRLALKASFPWAVAAYSRGVLVGGNGLLAVCAPGQDKLSVLSREYDVSAVAACSNEDCAWVSDWSRKRVYLYDLNKKEVRAQIAKAFCWGLWEDSEQNLWFTDSSTHSLMLYSRIKQIQNFYGNKGPGAQPGQLNCPRGVACMDQTIYVADQFNHRVVMLNKQKQVKGLLSTNQPWGISPALNILIISSYKSGKLTIAKLEEKSIQELRLDRESRGVSGVCLQDGCVLIASYHANQVLAFQIIF